MIVSEGRIGRVFVLRLGDGDRLPDAIEELARTRGVEAARRNLEKCDPLADRGQERRADAGGRREVRLQRQ